MLECEGLEEALGLQGKSSTFRLLGYNEQKKRVQAMRGDSREKKHEALDLPCAASKDDDSSDEHDSDQPTYLVNAACLISTATLGRKQIRLDQW